MTQPFRAADDAATVTGTRHWLTLLAALLSMVGPFTIDTYLPSFPDIEADFGISRSVLSQSLGVYLAAFAVSTLFWGPLADRIGRRRVILASMLLYLLASAGCALAEDASDFFLLRTLQGLAASGGFIAGRAMIRDAHDVESAHRAMSQVMLLFGLAPAVAPLLGGWLHDAFGWRSVFWFLTAFGLLLLALTLFARETLAAHHRQSFHPSSVARAYWKTLNNARFLLLVLTQGFTFAGLFLYIAGAPTVIYDFLGLSSSDFAWQFVPMVAGMMAGATLSGLLAHHWPARRVAHLGLAIALVSAMFNLLFALFLDPRLATVIGPLVVHAFGLAVAMPVLTIQALDCFPKRRGTAASMQGFLQMLVSASVASVAVPLLHDQWSHFVFGQAGFLLLALACWRGVRAKAPSNQ